MSNLFKTMRIAHGDGILAKFRRNYANEKDKIFGNAIKGL